MNNAQAAKRIENKVIAIKPSDRIRSAIRCYVDYPDYNGPVSTFRVNNIAVSVYSLNVPWDSYNNSRGESFLRLLLNGNINNINVLRELATVVSDVIFSNLGQYFSTSSIGLKSGQDIVAYGFRDKGGKIVMVEFQPIVTEADCY